MTKLCITGENAFFFSYKEKHKNGNRCLAQRTLIIHFALWSPAQCALRVSLLIPEGQGLLQGMEHLGPQLTPQKGQVWAGPVRPLLCTLLPHPAFSLGHSARPCLQDRAGM